MAKKPMTKAEIVAGMANEAGIAKANAQIALETIIKICAEEVKAGRPFKIAGLGTFSLRQRAARKGVNPATGEPLEIPASQSMGFKASSVVKDLLNPKEKK